MQRPTYHPYYLAEVEAAEDRAAAKATRVQRVQKAIDELLLITLCQMESNYIPNYPQPSPQPKPQNS